MYIQRLQRQALAHPGAVSFKQRLESYLEQELKKKGISFDTTKLASEIVANARAAGFHSEWSIAAYAHKAISTGQTSLDPGKCHDFWPPSREDFLEKVQPHTACVNCCDLEPQQWFLDYLPVTGGNSVELLVDGEQFGKALWEALDLAKSEILFTGLHFQRDWSLVRDRVHITLKDALHHLATKQEEPVKMYLLVNQFWADEDSIRHWGWDDRSIVAVGGALALTVSWPFALIVLAMAASNELRHQIMDEGRLVNYLLETANLFEEISKFPPQAKKNIKMYTDVHPGWVMKTHHQKTVVIDRKVCFVGGIDLTKIDGDRWDNPAHRIPREDDGRRQIEHSDYAYEHLWHDVHCKIEGNAVFYVWDNFRARWNFGDRYRLEKYGNHANPGIKAVPVGKTDDLYCESDGSASEENQYRKPSESSEANELKVPTEPETRAYQERTRQGQERGRERDFFGITTRRDYEHKIRELPAIHTLNTSSDSVLVQVVRSMPAGHYVDGEQKPTWNCSDLKWEMSAREAYIIGIRAAQKYIYLENQWVADDQILEEIGLALKRNQCNPRFFVIIVIPRKPLWAAGLGRDQEMWPSRTFNALKETYGDKFGVYCLQQQIPRERMGALKLDKNDIYMFGNTTQIYVHSKIMIVDDCWSLIGSANAGGISLLGVYNLEAKLRAGNWGSTPDSELSVIIYSEVFAKHFRETLWSEHLGLGSPVDFIDGATAFREQAAAPRARVRYSPKYVEVVPEAHRRRIIVAGVASFARIVHIPFRGGLAGSDLFAISIKQPPELYALYFKWRLVDNSGARLRLVAAIGGDEIGSGYTEHRVVATPPNGLAQLAAARKPAKILCRVMIATSSGPDEEGEKCAFDVDLALA